MKWCKCYLNYLFGYQMILKVRTNAQRTWKNLRWACLLTKWTSQNIYNADDYPTSEVEDGNSVEGFILTQGDNLVPLKKKECFIFYECIEIDMNTVKDLWYKSQRNFLGKRYI